MTQHDLVERMTAHFLAGGDIMYPLTALSLVMWTLAVAKIIENVRERRKESSPEQCMTFFRDNGTDFCQKGLARWQWDIMSQYLAERCDDPRLNRDILDSIRVRQENMTMRFVRTIVILAAIAPLLGLLGTVTGMITTFDVISQFGTGNARALASGISEALVTTQSGLVAAVPGMMLGALLYRRAEKLKGRMKRFCIGLQEQTDCLKAKGQP